MIRSGILLVLTLCFLMLSILHIVWLFRPIGDGVIPTENGKPIFKPGKLATLMVAFGLGGAAGLAFCQFRSIPFLSESVVFYGNIAVASVMAIRAIGDFRYCGFFKSMNGTLFAKRDTWIYSPFCLLVSSALGYATLVAR